MAASTSAVLALSAPAAGRRVPRSRACTASVARIAARAPTASAAAAAPAPREYGVARAVRVGGSTASPAAARAARVVCAAGRHVDVCVVLGSRSDLPIAEKATAVLEEFGISYELRVASAHRAPKYLESIIEAAEADGCKVFVGMAGVAAALPGVIASMTAKPVIGVPCGGRVPYDSLLSIVMMPPGMPVATVGVDRGDNAGVLAVQILAAFDAKLGAQFTAYRKAMTEKVIADDKLTVAERKK